MAKLATAAEEYGRQALAEFAAEDSPRWTAYSIELLGLTAHEQGRPDQARDCYMQAIEIYQQVSHRD
ncbi:tetratricopeptide repeat protein [Streptomyces sp. NPDC057966]